MRGYLLAPGAAVNSGPADRAFAGETSRFLAGLAAVIGWREMTADPPENDYESALAGWFAKPVPAPSADEDDGLFGLTKTAADPEALARVRDWVRQRFKLSEDAAIQIGRAHV